MTEYDHDTQETLADAVDTWTERASVGTLLLLIGFVVCILASLALRTPWAAMAGLPVMLAGLSLVQHAERRVRALRRIVDRGNPIPADLTGWFGAA